MKKYTKKYTKIWSRISHQLSPNFYDSKFHMAHVNSGCFVLPQIFNVTCDKQYNKFMYQHFAHPAPPLQPTPTPITASIIPAVERGGGQRWKTDGNRGGEVDTQRSIRRQPAKEWILLWAGMEMEDAGGWLGLEKYLFYHFRQDHMFDISVSSPVSRVTQE